MKQGSVEDDRRDRLPDAVGLGVRRCGSSWLHHALSSHPEVGKPARGLHFFSDEFDRGITWYAEQFAPYKDRKVVVDLSVSYLYPGTCGVSAQRIAQILPKAKLFVSLRDPVERAHSDYLRGIRTGEVPLGMGFAEAVRRFPVLLDRSRYASLLCAYCANNPSGVHVLLFDDLRVDCAGAFNALAGFIGAGPHPCPGDLGAREARGGVPRWEIAWRAAQGCKSIADGVARHSGTERAWMAAKRFGMPMWERVRRGLTRAVPIPAVLRHELVREFEADIAFVEGLTGRRLDGWRHA